MANQILNNDERLLLIEKYTNDKLNKPPKNIKDETLISNYGTDEQKARLQAARSAKAPEGTENETTIPAAGEPAIGTGTEPAGNAPAATVVETANTGTQGGFIEGTAQSVAEQPKPIEAAPVVENAQAAPDTNQEYIKAFTDYVELYQVMPLGTLTTAELIAANDKKREADKQAAHEAAKLQEEQTKRAASMALETVTIINNETKDSLVVSRLTWERFISKDGSHSLKPETPAELK